VVGLRMGTDRGDRAAKVPRTGLLLTVLTAILLVNFLDRIALGVVLQEIKLDFQLTDTQLGLLTGIAFTFFYSLMGIPIARWADRGNRVTIIAATTFVWSVAVALCGAARSFIQLMTIRVVAACGEAGCIPAAQSLIADHFDRSERPRATARYMLGLPLALITGYFATGWLNVLLGWRVTFAIIALPGFLLSAVALLVLREPRLAASLPVPREQDGLGTALAARHPPLGAVCRSLWGNRSFRNLVFGYSVWYFFGYGLLQWTPSFFIRSYGLSTGDIGTWLAVAYGAGGLGGVYLGGHLASRYAARNESLQLRSCAVAFILFSVLNACAYLEGHYRAGFLLLGIGALGGNMVQGPVLATIQSLVSPPMRAMSVALMFLFANLIGMGLGPLAAGALSDALHPIWGQESLRYALLLLCPGYLWAAWHLWRASRTVARDIHAACAEPDEGDPGGEHRRRRPEGSAVRSSS
jgi:MFS family permease